MGDESTREDLLIYAKIAEQAERYEDMVEFMDKVVRMGEELSREERNLLSVAHKNVVGARRSSFRAVDSQTAEDQEKPIVVTDFHKKIKEELKKKCCDILDLLDDCLIVKDFIPEVSENDPETAGNDKTESQVFYLKMKGDYYRYLVEVQSDKEEGKENAGKSLEAYLKATEIAKSESTGLDPTNPIRLGLALNFSVFYYEIENSSPKACSEAKCAFDEAISQLDGLSDTSYKDSTLIMQLLRDNLTLWTSEADESEN